MEAKRSSFDAVPERTGSFSLRAPPDLLSRLASIAYARHASMNECAKLAIRQFVENHEKRSKHRNPPHEYPQAPRNENEWTLTYEWLAFWRDTRIPEKAKQTVLDVLRHFTARNIRK